MIAAEILARVQAAGIRVRTDGERILASPRERLTDALRELIRAHRAELVQALDHVDRRELAHAGGTAAPSSTATSAEAKGAECMSCANLKMRVEHHEGTRRLFWWRCAKGYALMEGRNYGERVMLAPAECEAAGGFKPWTAGQR